MATQRYCSACGAAIAEDAAFCDACGSKLQLPVVSSAGAVAPAPLAAYTYATFWRRAAAYLVDLVVAAVLGVLVGLMWGAVAMIITVGARGSGSFTSDETSVRAVVFAIAFFAGWGAGSLAYQLIATARGGGFGKRLLGMRIVRESNGAAPGWGVAVLRLLASWLLGWMSSGVGWLLDYAWAIWDPRRQTLHDKAAGTVVVDVSRAPAPDADVAWREEAAPTQGTSTGLRPGAV